VVLAKACAKRNDSKATRYNLPIFFYKRCKNKTLIAALALSSGSEPVPAAERTPVPAEATTSEGRVFFFGPQP
jgi:hypothetical protein